MHKRVHIPVRNPNPQPVRIVHRTETKAQSKAVEDFEWKRRKIDWIGQKLGIKTQEDWYNVTGSSVRTYGGDLIQRYFQGSLSTALQTLYPEFEWNVVQFASLPHNYWAQIEHQRELFDHISKQLDIQTQEDWYSKTYKDIKATGGAAVLSSYYSTSLCSALQHIYPEFTWNAARFPYVPHNFWDKDENRREAMDWIAEQLGIERQEDWYSASLAEIKSIAPGGLIESYFRNSISVALRSTYPEYEWDASLLGMKTELKEHERDRMDRVALQLDIKEPSDWYSVTTEQLKECGVMDLHDIHGSLYNVLRVAYPEYEWDALNFHSVSRFFKKGKEYKRKALDRIAEQLGIKTQEDWYEVTLQDLNSVGAQEFFNSHTKSSLITTLQMGYPEFEWNPFLFHQVVEQTQENMKNLLDWFSEQLGIEIQEDWYSVSLGQLNRFSQSSMLLKSQKTLYELLSIAYPQFEWLPFLFHYWNDDSNDKTVFDWLSNQLGIELQQEWFSVTPTQIKELLHDRGLLANKYRDSLCHALQNVYPEFEWNPFQFEYHPPHFWKDAKNQRALLDWLGEQLGIETHEDWYSISTSDVTGLGADELISQHGSLLNAIRNIYSEFEWDFEAYHWKLKLNQRHIMDEIADTLGITTYDDWLRVSSKEVKELGAERILSRHGNSIYSALQYLYPEFEWMSDPQRLLVSITQNEWKDKKLQRELLDKLAEHLNIEYQEDWYQLSASLCDALQTCYPEYVWQVLRFPWLPQSFWKKQENQRELMDWMAEKLGVETQNDWYSVSGKQVRSLGGNNLLNMYHQGSLFTALQSVYPEFEWNPLLYSKRYSWRRLSKMKHCKKALDRIARQYNIETQSDWYSFIHEKIRTTGGRASWIVRALKKGYPEYSWKVVKNPDLPSLLLAKTWTEDIDPTGYWMSEKYDGSRAIWDGSKFISRLGEVWSVPEWFTEGFPKDMILDGELWGGVNTLERVQSVVRTKEPQDHDWKSFTFLVFDSPSLKEKVFEERMKIIEEYLKSNRVPFAALVKQEKCQGLDHLRERLREVEDAGGEGLMLRLPNSLYDFKRSDSLLKVKSFHDSEAKVIAYQPMQVRDLGEVGGLICELYNGQTFLITRGITSEIRNNPPPLGSIITFSFLPSSSGLPKFPAFKHIRFGVQH